MSGTVKHAKLETRTSRARLKRKREPHWRALVTGRAHLGWQRPPTGGLLVTNKPPGRWILRRYVDGKYSVRTLGWADDLKEADGEQVFSFEQAQALAKAMLDAPEALSGRLTVRRAMSDYIDYQRDRGKPVTDLISRTEAWINPALGNALVQELTTPKLQRWLATMAQTPAMKRTAQGGKQQFKAEPITEDDHRRRRSSSNRVLTMLKAALNLAFKHKKVASDSAWRHVEPFEGVDAARVRYLTVAQAKRLINTSDREFRPLLRAALETGCRYSELCRLECQDFNPASNTVHIRRSKTGEGRHVVLTDEGAEFFRLHVAGLLNGDLIFRRANGSPWRPSQQARPLAAACARAKIEPAINFHGLRHTWASLSIMAEVPVPLMVVAKNLGHSDTRMVERHYGHMAKSYVADAIRAGAPKFGRVRDRKVVPLG
jgi:integrase